MENERVEARRRNDAVILRLLDAPDAARRFAGEWKAFPRGAEPPAKEITCGLCGTWGQGRE